MPCTKDLKIDTSKPVLVTGGTGYVAGVLIRELLEKGVCVHTTVRDPSKKDRLQYLQDEADKSKGTIKFFQADLMTPGSFIEACKECHIVFHTASPYTAVVEDPQKDLIEPAVHGTENVLNACNATPTVKRVVVTSSCAAIYTDAADTDPVNGTNEETWNRTATLDHMPYSLSKTLAEQKAWVMAGSQNQWVRCYFLVIGCDCCPCRFVGTHCSWRFTLLSSCCVFRVDSLYDQPPWNFRTRLEVSRQFRLVSTSHYRG